MTLVNKLFVLVFWLLAFFSWQQNWQDWLGMLPAVALFVAAIHVLEVLYFVLRFREKSKQPVWDSVQILVFGMFHLQRFINR